MGKDKEGISTSNFQRAQGLHLDATRSLPFIAKNQRNTTFKKQRVSKGAFLGDRSAAF